jgi:uncharacterized protein YkwD
MANRTALLLLAAIVVTATGAGAVLGLYVSGWGPFTDAGGADGDGGTATPTATDASGESTDGNDGPGDAEATAGPATPTGTEGVAMTSTPTPLETVAADSFNETRIALLVAAEINDRRDERGLWTLRHDDTLSRMATNHSRRMNEQGYVSHAAGGFTTEDRYRRNDLSDRCGIPDDSNTGLREGSEIETLDEVSAEAAFGGRLNRDERGVAADAVESWFNRTEERRKLTDRNAGSVGTGVVVTAANRAYITVDLCT